MVRTLDEIAQALFGSWFVDSDVSNSEIWAMAAFGEHVEVEKGLSYKGAFLSDGGTPMVNLNSVLEGGGWKEGGLKFYTGPFKPKHAVEPGDVVVANTEQGHDYLLIG